MYSPSDDAARGSMARTTSSASQIIERLETQIKDQKVILDVQAQQIRRQDLDIEGLGQRLKDAEKDARIARLQFLESQRRSDKFRRQSEEERNLRIRSIQAMKQHLRTEPTVDAETQTEPMCEFTGGDVDDPPACIFHPHGKS